MILVHFVRLICLFLNFYADSFSRFVHNMEKHSLPVSVELDAKVTSISGDSNTIPIEDTPCSGSGAPSDVLELSTKAMIASNRPVLSVDQSNISDIEFDKSQIFRFVSFY